LQIYIVVRSAMAEILAAEYLLDVYIQRANTSKKSRSTGGDSSLARSGSHPSNPPVTTIASCP
jgi:hypothetical protein